MAAARGCLGQRLCARGCSTREELKLEAENQAGHHRFPLYRPGQPPSSPSPPRSFPSLAIHTIGFPTLPALSSAVHRVPRTLGEPYSAIHRRRPRRRRRSVDRHRCARPWPLDRDPTATYRLDFSEKLLSVRNTVWINYLCMFVLVDILHHFL